MAFSFQIHFAGRNTGGRRSERTVFLIWSTVRKARALDTAAIRGLSDPVKCFFPYRDTGE